MFLTYPSVDAVTIATFPSSLRLAAAVELILIALKVPKHNFTLELCSVIFQAFSTGFRAGLEISSPTPYPSPYIALYPASNFFAPTKLSSRCLYEARAKISDYFYPLKITEVPPEVSRWLSIIRHPGAGAGVRAGVLG